MSRRPPHMAGLSLALLLATAPDAVLAAGRCYGDWSDAAPVVSREKLRSAREVQDMVRHQLGGDVVRIDLCEGDGGFVYRLVLRQSDGRIGTMFLRAAGGSADERLTVADDGPRREPDSATSGDSDLVEGGPIR